MKPTFALDLRNDTITLLHRAGSVWHVIGATEFGAPDMDAALAQMRATALDLSPQGIATKLIIPNDQILYTRVHAPGPGKVARRAQIRDALVGRTPYEVDELAYDWAEPLPEGSETLMVAVIARETLAEAEGFVASHGLNPVGFTAVPDDPAFGREPWFGASSIVADILPAGTKVEGDTAPVRIAAVAPQPEPAQPEAAEPEVEALAETPMPAPDAAEPQTVAPEPVAAEPVAAEPVTPDPAEVETDEAPEVDLSFLTAPSAYADEAAFPASEALAKVQTEEATEEFVPEPDPEPAPVAAAPVEEPPLPAWLGGAPPAVAAEPPAGQADAARFVAPTRDPAQASRRWFDDVEEAPMALDVEADDPAPEPPASPAAKVAVSAPAIAIDDDLPPAPAAPVLEAFASRRSTQPGTQPAAPAAAPALSGAQRPTTPAPAAKPAKGLRGLVTAPGIAGLRGKPKAADPKRPEAKRIVTIKPEARPPAARPAKPGEASFVAGRIGQRERGRPAYLLLVLTIALLIAMALVAAWSSYLALRGTTPEPETQIASTPPTVTAPVEATVPDPAPQTAVTETAPDAAPATAEITTATAPQIATATADAPGAVVVTSQDPPVVLPDPVAQPVIAALAAGPPPAPDIPPAFGTVLEFDATGLIKPTPEGIETPEGVFLRAGKPPVIPPRRSPVAEAAALAAAPPAAPTAAPEATETAAPLAVDPALANARPKPRPATLVPPGLDDTGLAPLPGDAVQIVLRPRVRPDSVLAAGSAARQAATPATPGADASLAAGAVAEGGLIATPSSVQISANTVTISRVPAPRPRDLERSVEAAVAAALQPGAPAAPEPEPAPEPEVAAVQPQVDEKRDKPLVGKPDDTFVEEEPEVASAAPSTATRGAVAKNATFRNAIDLGETNLIGIYGTENRRYAMVRTSAGSYKKVKVGDRVDGGKVAAISTKELRLQKGGSMVVLKIPGG